MRGVLVVAHGSRREGAHRIFRDMVAEAAGRTGTVVETAFLEFSEETIEQGLRKLTARKVTQIEVLPYFLFEGVHTREDIQAELDRFTRENPGTRIEMGVVFGSDPRLTDLLADRIRG